MELFLSIVKNPTFIQAFGFLGTAFVVIGMQSKIYGRVAFCKIANEFICAIHYLMLGRYDGMLVNLTSCVTNPIYWYRIKKGKTTRPFQIAFGALFVVIVFLQWKGWISILVLIAKVLSSIALGINNTKIIRFLNLIGTSCWLIFNIFAHSIPGIVTDILVLASIIAAIIRIDILNRNKEAV